MKHKLNFLLLTFFLHSCNVVPYKEESSCSIEPGGKCVSVIDAYEESLQHSDHTTINEINTTSNTTITQSSEPSNFYTAATKIIPHTNEDKLPLVQDPVIRRVLILPHTNENKTVWYEPRHIYYIETTAKWNIDNQASSNNDKNFNIF